MEERDKISRKDLEESGEVLKKRDGLTQNNSEDHNNWIDAMKNVPSYEEHMEQLEAEEEEISM